jgi:hypothetical protein
VFGVYFVDKFPNIDGTMGYGVEKLYEQGTNETKIPTMGRMSIVAIGCHWWHTETGATP